MYRIEPRHVWAATSAVHVRQVRSYGGDVLVTRRKGDEGRKQNQLQAVRSLGLRKIEDVCVVTSAERRAEGELGRQQAGIFGQAVVSQHLLSFLQLPDSLPPGRFDDFWLLEDGMMMYREEYTDAQGPGELLVVGEGEYLQAETVSERLVVAWSSAKTAAAFFRQAIEVLGSPAEGDAAAFVQLDVMAGDGAEGSGLAPEVMEYVELKEPPIATMRMDFSGGLRATWTAPAARLKGYSTEFAEVSLSLPSESSRQSVFDLVGGTASAGLLDHQGEAFREIRQLAA